MRSYIFILILLGNIVYSQDSIQDSYAKKSRWVNDFFIENFDRIEYWQDGFTNNFTTSSLYLKTNDKNFHLGQEAKNNTTFGVNTHGKWQNPKNKIIFTGSIDISKEYLNKKAWNNSPFEVKENGIMQDPHYYLVQRPGNWKNTKYNLSGAIQVPVFRELKIIGAVKYNLEEKYRTNLDPRTESSINSLEGKLGFNYTIYNNEIGISFNKGYLDKNTDHSRVIKEQDTPYYYDKYLKWMWGYGQFFNNKKDHSRREGIIDRFSSTYTFKNTKNLISINFNKTDIDINNFDSESKSNPKQPENNQFGITKTSIYHLNLFAQYKMKEGHQLHLLLNGSHQKTNNFIKDLNGTSYRSNEDDYFLQLSHSYPIKNLLNEYGVKFHYQNYKQNDLFSEISTQGDIILVGVFAEKEFNVKKFTVAPYIELNYLYRNNDLSIKNEPDFSNVSDSDFLNLTRKAFFSEVIYNDHEILNQDILSFKIEPEFVFTTKKNYKVNLGTGLQFQYLSKQKKTNKFFNVSLSINY